MIIHVNKIRKKVLRGRVQFPTGGIVRDPLLQSVYPRDALTADLVRFQKPTV